MPDGCNRRVDGLSACPQWFERDIGERRAIEVGEKGRLGRAHARLEPTAAVKRAGAATPAQAFDERLALFKQAHNGAEPDLRRRPGQCRPAATAAPGFDQPGLRKPLHDLGQMVARQPELVGQIGGRKGAIRRARHAHQHAQAVVGEGGEAHRRECPAGIGIYNTY